MRRPVPRSSAVPRAGVDTEERPGPDAAPPHRAAQRPGATPDGTTPRHWRPASRTAARTDAMARATSPALRRRRRQRARRRGGVPPHPRPAVRTAAGQTARCRAAAPVPGRGRGREPAGMAPLTSPTPSVEDGSRTDRMARATSPALRRRGRQPDGRDGGPPPHPRPGWRTAAGRHGAAPRHLRSGVGRRWARRTGGGMPAWRDPAHPCSGPPRPWARAHRAVV